MFRHITSKLLLLGTVVAWLGLGASCVSPDEVLYIQDANRTGSEKLSQNYQPTIQKDDLLSVSVGSKQPELVAPFSVSELGSTTNGSAGKSHGYLVDNKGDIVLPIIGRIHAAGKTCTALSNDIAAALRDNGYITDASVNVQIENFKFSILGQVNSPGTYQVKGQRVTILEALAQAGDLQIAADRSIQVIRETNGQRSVATLDLRSKDIFSSPYYYLHQNDVIYVVPSQTVINSRSEEMQMVGWTMSGLGLITAIIAVSCM